MLRFALLLVLFAVIARAFWRVVDGVLDGLGVRSRTKGRQPSVAMARDPECGTYVIPDRGFALSDGSSEVFFCSAACRDKYRARSSRATSGSKRFEGRSA